MSDAEVEAEMRQKALEKNYGLDPVAAFKARFEPPQLYKKPESISDEQLADLRQAGQSELVSGAMGGTNLPMPMAIGAIRKTPTGKLLGTVAEEIPRVGATEQNVVVNNLAEQAVREGLFEGKQEAKKAAIGNKVVPPKVGEGKLTAIGGVGNLDQPMAKEVSQTTDKFYDTKYKVNPRWVVEKLDDGKHWVYDRLKEEKNIGFDFQRDAEKLATEWNNEKDYYRRSAPKPKDTFSYNVDTKREQEIIENIKNGFGDKFPEKEFKVAEATAKSKNSPYAPVLSKGTKGMRGEQTAYWPNFDAIPTGKIGDLKDFKSGDPYKIHSKSEPLNWFDLKYGATKKLIEKHAKSNMPVEITTASDLIAHDDYSKILPQGSKVNMVLANTVKDGSHYSPLPSDKRMLKAFDKLKQEGIEVNLYKKDGKELRKMKPFEIKQLQKQKNAYYTPSEEGAK